MIIIDVNKDSHINYRNKSIKGAIAKHILKLRAGETLHVLKVLGADGDTISDQRTMAAYVHAISKHHNAKYISKTNPFGTFITCVSEPLEHTKTCSTGDECQHPNQGNLRVAEFSKNNGGHLTEQCKNCVTRIRKEKREKEATKDRKNESMVNLYLMGRLGI